MPLLKSSRVDTIAVSRSHAGHQPGENEVHPSQKSPNGAEGSHNVTYEAGERAQTSAASDSVNTARNRSDPPNLFGQSIESLKLPIPSVYGRPRSRLSARAPQAAILPFDQSERKSLPAGTRVSTFDDTASLDLGDTLGSFDENNTMVYRPDGSKGVSQQLSLNMSTTAQSLDASSRSNDNKRNRPDIMAAAEGHLGAGTELHDAPVTRQELDAPTQYRRYSQNPPGPEQVMQVTPSKLESGQANFKKPFLANTKLVSFSDSPALDSRRLAREPSPDVPLPRHTRTASSSSHSPTPGVVEIESRTAKRKGLSRKISTSKSSSKHRLSNAGRRVHPLERTPEFRRGLEAFTSSDDELIRPADIISHKSPGVAVAADEPPTQKRARVDDLDYDMEALKTLTYQQLHNEDFNHNPRNEQAEPACNTATKDKNSSLAHRLENLGGIPEKDQRELFRSQTDAESIETGSWFIAKFQKDLKRLFDVRLEKRKISMRYEAAVRKREKEVEWSIGGVEGDLAELKKGGKELIDGRKAGVRTSSPHSTS